MKFEKLL